jgi:hypothetical protein
MQTRLKKASILKTEKITVIHQSLIKKRIGVLPPRMTVRLSLSLSSKTRSSSSTLEVTMKSISHALAPSSLSAEALA